MAKKSDGKTVTVEQIGSPIRRPARPARDADRPRPQHASAAARRCRTRPPVRGMIAKVQHLVRVVDEA